MQRYSWRYLAEHSVYARQAHRRELFPRVSQQSLTSFAQFVTFVEANAAFTFYQVATYQGLTLNNRRLKVGWGKNPGSLSASLALQIQNGATRNVYIGNIEDFDVFNEDKLKRDFGEYGEIELVNFLKEK